MRLALAFFALLFATSVAFGQKQGQELVDSLHLELPRMKRDTDKVNALNAIGFCFYFINPDSGVIYGRKALALARDADWEKGQAASYRIIGINYMTMSKSDRALECFDTAYRFFIASKDENNAARIMGNMAQVYDDKGNYLKALEYNLNALKIYEKTKNEKGKAFVYSNLGNIYANMHKPSDAIRYHTLALAYHTSVSDSQSMAIDLGNLGNNYSNRKEYEKALQHHLQALGIYERLQDSLAIANKIQNIASVYLSLKELPKALHFATIALRIYETAKDENGKAIAMCIAGKCHLEMARQSPATARENLQQAANYNLQAIQIFAASGQLMELYLAYGQLSYVYEAQGNYKDALTMFRRSFDIKDSVLNADKNLQFANLEKEKALEDKKHAEEDRRAQVQLNELTHIKRRNETIFYCVGIALLAIAIVVISRQRKKIEHLLLDILPADIVKQLKEDGKSEAKYYDNVTVLFTDFVGFTSVADKLSATELVRELNTCFSAFDAIMEKYKIEKIKTLGDAYLAVSGLPNPDPDHAINIVKAALEIRDFIQARKEQLGDYTFNIRIGIHSGNVVAGIIGVKKYAYDIWGDTVNTAARLEQNSQAGKVNISETTFEKIKDKYACTYRGEIQAKNKGMLKMYFVDGLVTA